MVRGILIFSIILLVASISLTFYFRDSYIYGYAVKRAFDKKYKTDKDMFNKLKCSCILGWDMTDKPSIT